MITKHNWLEILMFLPPILLLVAINLIWDSGFYFRSNINDLIAELILQDKYIQSFSGNFNQREVKRKLIEKINKDIDCIAVGPSLIYSIGNEIVNSSKFYNLGIGACNHYDLFAFFALLKINKINYKKVIICMDFLSIFNVDYANNSLLSEPLMNYTKYMIDFLENKPNLISPEINYWSIIKNAPILSISYFKESYKIPIKQIKKYKSISFDLIELLSKDSIKTSNCYSKDGSFIYSYDYENRSNEKFIKDAHNYMFNKKVWNKEAGGTFDERFKCNTSEEFKKHFLLLIDYLKKNNTEIIFWYHPFPPIIWDKINYREYPGIYGLDLWSRKLAEEKGIKTVGDYNPHKCGVTNESFADARHLKRSAIAKLFKF